jgi:hypothetical protein
MAGNGNGIKINKRVFLYLGILVGIGALLSYINIFFPSLFTAIVNFFWIMMLISVAVFLVLGFLVIVGLKNEVSNFLDVLLEGSLTILDAIEFLKKLYKQFITILKEFIYFITPVLAAWLAAMLYFAILVAYKIVGRDHDVTLMTALISAGMVVAVGFLNKPSGEQRAYITWFQQISKRFKDYFSDSFEIVIFIFFLTMDSVNLFFLPKYLNIPLTAKISNYDLMLRGANVTSQLTVTVVLVTLAISVEILRNIIRLVAMSFNYYSALPKNESQNTRIKESIRLSFGDAKDDLLKFITFTTALILVFLVFPRLKLYAMVVASLTGLLLDFVVPGRLQMREGTDLLSRILNRTFNL